MVSGEKGNKGVCDSPLAYKFYGSVNSLEGSSTPNDSTMGSDGSSFTSYRGGRGGYSSRGGGRGGRGGYSSYGNNNGGGHYQQQQSASYKTQLCKNFNDGDCKYGAKCAFAHGEADLKKPSGNPGSSGPRPGFNQPPPPVPGLQGFNFNGLPPMPQPQLNIFSNPQPIPGSLSQQA